MAGLPKHIIKKYGVSKKAWRVYRGQKSSKKKPKIRSVQTMARKRRKSSPRRATKRRSSKGANTMLMQGLGAAVYGASRAKVSNLLTPVTSKVPLGDVADEAVMLALSYLLAKGKIPMLNKVPMLRQVGKAGFYIEAARLGEAAISGSIFGNMATSTTSSGKLF